eukprot:scaffold8263_cov104-Isochrysis_galbana.AAC.3
MSSGCSVPSRRPRTTAAVCGSRRRSRGAELGSGSDGSLVTLLLRLLEREPLRRVRRVAQRRLEGEAVALALAQQVRCERRVGSLDAGSGVRGGGTTAGRNRLKHRGAKVGQRLLQVGQLLAEDDGGVDPVRLGFFDHFGQHGAHLCTELVHRGRNEGGPRDLALALGGVVSFDVGHEPGLVPGAHGVDGGAQRPMSEHIRTGNRRRRGGRRRRGLALARGFERDAGSASSDHITSSAAPPPHSPAAAASASAESRAQPEPEAVPASTAGLARPARPPSSDSARAMAWSMATCCAADAPETLEHLDILHVELEHRPERIHRLVRSGHLRLVQCSRLLPGRGRLGLSLRCLLVEPLEKALAFHRVEVAAHTKVMPCGGEAGVELAQRRERAVGRAHKRPSPPLERRFVGGVRSVRLTLQPQQRRRVHILLQPQSRAQLVDRRKVLGLGRAPRGLGRVARPARLCAPCPQCLDVPHEPLAVRQQLLVTLGQYLSRDPARPWLVCHQPLVQLERKLRGHLVRLIRRARAHRLSMRLMVREATLRKAQAQAQRELRWNEKHRQANPAALQR